MIPQRNPNWAFDLITVVSEEDGAQHQSQETLGGRPAGTLSDEALLLEETEVKEDTYDEDDESDTCGDDIDDNDYGCKDAWYTQHGWICAERSILSSKYPM